MPMFKRVSALDNQVFKFVQTVNAGTILSTSVTVPTSTATGFTAGAHINQFTSFAAIFDQYKIDLIEVWLIPTATTANEQPAGMIYSAVDYDNATALTAAQIMQHTNVVCTPPSLGHYHKFVPHIAIGAYTGAFGGFANQKAPWIDTASSSVIHYGLCVSADTIPNAVYVIDSLIRISVSFRNIV